MSMCLAEWERMTATLCHIFTTPNTMKHSNCSYCDPVSNHKLGTYEQHIQRVGMFIVSMVQIL